MIDLHPSRSLVRDLQNGGNAVYLLEWIPVAVADAENDLAYYVDDAIDAAVEWLREEHAVDQLNLLGICQGGTFSLCYASLYPDKIAKLVCMVTPVDFHAGDSLLAHWSANVDFDRLIERPRNIPGALITTLFQMLRPFDDIRRQIQLIDRESDDGELREFAMLMDQWVFDCPDQPGRAFAQFANQCFRRNQLIAGSMMVGNRVVDLARIKMPLLNVYASADHIVPRENAMALAGVAGASSYESIEFPGGHVGLLVSEKARRTVTPDIVRWLKL